MAHPDFSGDSEYLACLGTEDLKISEVPKIELIKIEKGKQLRFFLDKNVIVFFIKGRSTCVVDTTIAEHTEPEYVLFVQACHYFTAYTEESEAELMIFRIDIPVNLCGKYPVQTLCKKRYESGLDSSGNTGLLRLKGRHFAHYIESVIDYLSITSGCNHYFDIKIQEFLLLLRYHYTEKELSQFFSVLNTDADFSSYVLANRNVFPTVVAFAESMNMHQKQFTRQFKALFHQTPYSWMKKGRIVKVHFDLTATNKSIGQIAFDNGFKSVSQFSKFCKVEIGRTPVELRHRVCHVSQTPTNIE